MAADDALHSARGLQDRLHAAVVPTAPRNPEALRAEIRALLIDASDENALSSPVHEIIQMYNYRRVRNAHGEHVLVSCGEAMDHGAPGGAYLHKPDGSRLSFALTVYFERHDPGRLVSYRFHLQFPDGAKPRFIRFDLNGEGVAHEALLEPRFHLHPGSDEIRTQLPPMTPADVLHKLIYGVATDR